MKGALVEDRRRQRRAGAGSGGLTNALCSSVDGSSSRAVKMSTGVPGAGGGGATIGATRGSMASGRPIHRSSFKGSAMRLATNSPTDTPTIRRITSPASQPYVPT